MCNGTAAHWGIIVGFEAIYHSKQARRTYRHERSYVWLGSERIVEHQKYVDKTKDVLILVQHTMSSKVMLCWWSTLLASNLQVERYADKVCLAIYQCGINR